MFGVIFEQWAFFALEEIHSESKSYRTGENMFNLFAKKKTPLEVRAPFAGRVIDITEVKDDVFAQMMMGDGVAIIPDEGSIYAPVDGTVSALAVQLHALGITSNDGMELIVHYGIDTVKYQGEGFEMLVKEGQKVSVGDLILKADMDRFTADHVDLTSPIVLINSDGYEIVEKPSLGKTVSAGDVLYVVKKK